MDLGRSGGALSEPFNLARFSLAENAARRAGKIGLLVASGDDVAPVSMTFGEIGHAVLGLAGGIDGLGLEAGSRVVIRMGNEPDTILAFFAVIAAGHVAVPTSMMLTPDEARFLVSDAGAAAVILGRESADEAGYGEARIIDPAAFAGLKAAVPLADYAPTSAEDPAYLVYTSGTTGRPKGVLHAHRVALGRAPMREDWLGLLEDDLVLHAGAFNWTYTLGVGVLDPWSCGATAALARGVSDPADWPRLIERLGATIFAAVPGVYRQILKRGWAEGMRLPSLRHGLAAGEALPIALLDEWRAKTGLEIYEAFGMSEISTFVSSSPTTPTKPGSPGRPQRGRKVAALPVEGGETPVPAGETGLLAVHRSDPGLMRGYWRRPEEDEAVFRGDWFVSGDLVSFDEDGYLWHHGRADDIMNALGYRVSPAEVEAALFDHPSVADVGVAEWRVREDLSVIAAFMVLKEGAGPDEAALASVCAEKLASYKRPKIFHFVDRLPRSANGKLQRKRLGETVRR
ncbi:acyl-CoA synthetase [Hansschlegelia quercus]|uniref:AMP-dependent synthetase n=1 Tax=Hansschlegelia quercus TaxID=2528245 RepID=A0A4Q9GK04_9HYPH|nr:AMP-dependent synthetase [Hansschlegelia quercus]